MAYKSYRKKSYRRRLGAASTGARGRPTRGMGIYAARNRPSLTRPQRNARNMTRTNQQILARLNSTYGRRSAELRRRRR